MKLSDTHLGVRGLFAEARVPACGVWSQRVTGNPGQVTCDGCKATLDYVMAGWRSVYEDWGRAERDQAAGYRLELMAHGRYIREVSALMMRPCLHKAEAAGQMTLPEVPE